MKRKDFICFLLIAIATPLCIIYQLPVCKPYVAIIGLSVASLVIIAAVYSLLSWMARWVWYFMQIGQSKLLAHRRQSPQS